MTDSAPIAYLTGSYPKVSHTFIQREIAALEALGLTIAPCTVRRTPDAELTAGQEAERARTFAILSAARRPARLAGAHWRALRHGGRAWLRAAGLAWRTRPAGVKAALWQGFYLAEATVLADHLRKIGAVHLHNHFMDSSCTVAMLAAEMTGLPYSFTLHGPTELYEPHRWRFDEKIARAAFSAYISHFARSQGMLFSDPAHWDRMRIVHCGVDPARFTPAPAGGDGTRLIFIGRMAGVKGAPLMIDALARLRAAHPAVTLTMVGDGPERPALEARARDLGLGDAVRFTGYQSQDQVAAHVQEADILALPSFAEGVPVVLMEAMASGKPVVATRIAGISELVEDGVNGLMAAPGDLDGLVDALDRLIRDGDLRARMGRAGRDKVVRDYAIDREAAWLAALFRGSLAGRLPDTLRPAP